MSLEKQPYYSAEVSAIINCAFCGIIRVNSRGQIVYVNEKAKQYFGLGEEKMFGCYLPNLLYSLDEELLHEVIGNGESIFSIATATQICQVLLNIEPVFLEGKIDGAIVAVKKKDNIQKKSNMAANDINRQPAIAVENLSSISPALKNAIRKAKHAAYVDAPVLICGEPGTEKHQIAKFIHEYSSRHNDKYIEVECGAIEPDRLNELLFGNLEKNTENGDVKPLVEWVEGGTLFLNQIEKLTPELQFRISRLIKGRLIPSNDLRSKPLDVRVIAATSCDLRSLVKKKEFREDLFYSINVIMLQIPPLRSRSEDISSYISFFIERYSNKYSKPVHLLASAFDRMNQYQWPGNVRELDNFCQRIVLATQFRNINVALINQEFEKMHIDSEETAFNEPLRYNEEAKKIIGALKQYNGNRSLTSEALGISKTTLWRKMQKYGITEFM